MRTSFFIEQFRWLLLRHHHRSLTGSYIILRILCLWPNLWNEIYENFFILQKLRIFWSKSFVNLNSIENWKERNNYISANIYLFKVNNRSTTKRCKICSKLTINIVGKGGHTPPPFSKTPPFLEIQDVPTFHRSIGKTKEVNNSCNQFVYNFYRQSILISEECLQKWWDASLI